MKPRTALTLALLGLTFGGVGAAVAAAAERGSWDDYQVLIERNIFSRDRRPKAAEAARPQTPPPPPAQRFITLRGVSRLGEEISAFLEDSRTGQTSKVRTGSEVAGGTITAVGFNCIHYSLNGREVEVAVGENLEGSGAPAPAAAPSGAPATGGAQTPAPSGATESVLERLRRQRMQEVGQ